MYGIFTYIYHKNQPKVGVYTIHGSFGLWKLRAPVLFPGDESVVSDTNVNQTNQTKHNWESLDLGSIRFAGSEIRRSPVEVGS